MIYHIIKSYFVILLSVGIGAISIFIFGLYWILRKPQKASLQNHANQAVQQQPSETESNQIQSQSQSIPDANLQKNVTFTSNDISAIAGDDVFSTQLDLGRAYVETGRKQLAKKILEHVVEQGSDAQQDEARKLLGLI